MSPGEGKKAEIEETLMMTPPPLFVMPDKAARQLVLAHLGVDDQQIEFLLDQFLTSRSDVFAGLRHEVTQGLAFRSLNQPGVAGERAEDML